MIHDTRLDGTLIELADSSRHREFFRIEAAAKGRIAYAFRSSLLDRLGSHLQVPLEVLPKRLSPPRKQVLAFEK